MTTILYYSATAAELPVLSRAARSVQRTRPDLRVRAWSQPQLGRGGAVEAFVAAAGGCDVLVLSLHGGTASCPAWETLLQKRSERRRAGLPLAHWHVHPDGNDEEALSAAREHADGHDSGIWTGVHALLRSGGPVNLAAALEVLAGVGRGRVPTVPEPVEVLAQGIHHPVHGAFATFAGFEAAAAHHRTIAHGTRDDRDGAAVHGDTDPPVVGILFPQTYWLNDNTRHVDALVGELESLGARTVPVFCHRFRDDAVGARGADEVLPEFFSADGRRRIDVIVNVIGMSMTLVDPSLSQVLPGLDVPVLQATTCSAPAQWWSDSPQGLTTLDVTMQAAQPEFDGNLITLPIATRETDEVDPVTGAVLARLEPLPERTAALARLALRWAALRRLPNADKRVAVVFHHHPPRNDRLGCAAGLDSFESVRLLLRDLADAGYRVDHQYDRADDLARVLLDGLTCDRRWLSDEQMLARARAVAPAEQVERWHADLPDRVREAMVQTWGTPPGDLFVHAGRMGFAGETNGNILLTVQPPRGALEKAGETLHDLVLPPPHHYLAHYRWIRDVFRAHAVIHVGTHGSLEWLPGKSLGLSRECYPDLALGDLPNIYPYIINNPGEGTQAKRRSACALVDHLTPPFRNADLYEQTAQVDRALQEYGLAAHEDPAKLPGLADLLWQAVQDADLHHDLGLTGDRALADVDAFAERVHEYLTELADAQISDGLHVLGELAEGDRLVEYLAQLTRLPTGDVPSLREEVLRAGGHDPQEVAENTGRVLPNSPGISGASGISGRTGGQVLLAAHATAVELLGALARRDHDPSAVEGIVRDVLGRPCPRVAAVLDHVATDLLPRLRGTAAERHSVLGALSGRFVRPGPSGAPTRGSSDVLPTGRNFFSVDPRCLPTPGAWVVGRALGEAVLHRHLDQEGRYPRNIGIIVWGTANMRSRGEDIAQVLHLLGLRPVWNAAGRVDGLEVVPIEELGRPRIDVTARISGFFRDAFGNLVELLDRAVAMVAALAEPEGDNFLRAHVVADARDCREEGADEDEAWRTASLRIFGCPPGTYGAGVEELIESKAWRTGQDLADAYVRYSAHAYGQGVYGRVSPQAFRRQLGRMDVTVKNEDTREWDMLSCTDFYSYHGGLIAAAESVRGKAPLSVVGDSSDPRRVRVRTTAEETKLVLRSRVLNPTWIAGLRRHGYKGAGDLSKVLDILFGWDATADVMDDWMYERVADRYALDPELRDWMLSVNPHALQNILDKLLEAVQRGLWTTTEERRSELQEAYLAVEGDVEEALEGDDR
jgi:cobaltochelatase CobN